VADNAGREAAAAEDRRRDGALVVCAMPEPLPQIQQGSGIDLGLTYFAVLSDGRKISAVPVPPSLRD
jgi:transposase